MKLDERKKLKSGNAEPCARVIQVKASTRGGGGWKGKAPVTTGRLSRRSLRAKHLTS